MFTIRNTALHALLVVVSISVIVGCSSSGRKPTGASARAEKGLITGNDPNQYQEPVDPFSENGRPLISTEELLSDKAASMGVTNLCARILFDYDQSQVKPEFIACLDNVAAFLNANPNINVLIEGHCDERGTQEYNLALGEKRAMTTLNYLTAKGVSPNRFTTRSKGEENPVALGSNESAWSQNRRAEFYAIQ